MAEEFKISLGVELDGSFDAIKSQLDSLSSDPIKLKIDTSGVMSQISDIKKEIQSLNNLLDNVNRNMPTGSNPSGGSKSSLSNYQKALRNVYNLSKQISNMQLRTNTLKSSGLNTNELVTAEKRLSELRTTYNNLLTTLNSGDKTSIDFKNVNKDLNEAKLSISEVSHIVDDAKVKLAEKIKINFDNNEITKIESDFRKLNNASDNAVTAMNAFRTANSNMTTSLNSSNIDNIIRDYEDYQKVLKDVKSQIDINNRAEKEMASASKLQNMKDALSLDIDLWSKNNADASDDLINRVNQIKSAVQSADSVTLGNLRSQFNNVSKEAKLAGDSTNTFGNQLKSGLASIGKYLSLYLSFDTAINGLREMYQAVLDVDTAMTELYKVTDESESTYNRFLSNSGEVAKSLGRDMSSYITQTSEWAKLGYDLSQSQDLAKLSSVYANVGEVSDETAVSDMVTAMKAYNIETSNAVSIIDSLNKLGNEFAVTSADLGEALSKSASSMNEAGADMDETLAMITGGSEITQNAGEFGNFLKVASMRIRGMKGELEDLGEEVDDNIESVSKVQTQILNLTHGKVNIFDENNEFRNYYEIMEEIAAIYDKLSSTDRASLSELLFGKQRGNQGAALIQAFQSGQVQKALEASRNAMGSAQAEQDKWMESLQAKIQQMQAVWQDFSVSFMDSDFVKGAVSGLTDVLELLDSIVDNFGAAPIAAGGLGIVNIITSITSAIAGLKKNGDVINFGTVFSKAFGNASQAFSNFSKTVSSSSGVINIAKAAISGLWSVISAHPIVTAVAAIGILATAFDKLYVSAEEANENMENSFAIYEEARQNVVDVNTELDNAKTSMDELLTKDSLTFVEEGELQKLRDSVELLQIQADLAEKEEARAAKQAANSAIEAYNKNFTEPISEQQTHEYEEAIMSGATMPASLSAYESDISAQIAQLHYFEEQIKNLNKTSDDYNEDYLYWQGLIDNTTDSIYEQLGTLTSYKENLETLPYEDLSYEARDALDSINSDIEYIYKELDPDKWKQIQFDKIFDDKDFADAKQELINMAKESDNLGVSVDDVKEKYPELADAVVDAGFSLRNLVNNINSEAGIKDIDNVTEQIKDKFKQSIEDASTEVSEDDEANLEVKADAEVEIEKTSLEDFNNWVDELSDEEKIIVFDIMANQDTSGWNLEDFEVELNLRVNEDEAVESIEGFLTNASNAISQLESVNSSLQSSMSSSGLGAEFDTETQLIVGDIANIKAAYQDLEGYDADVLFEKTANGIHVNRDALKALQDQQEAITKQNFIKEQIDLQNKLNDAIAKRDSLEAGTVEFDNAQKNIDLLRNQLQQVQELSSAYDGVTSNFNKFMMANSSANERDSYETIANSYESVKETLDAGWAGDDSVNAYLDLMLSASQRTKDAYADFEKLNQTIEGTSHSLTDYFITDAESGKVVTDGLFNFLDDVNAKLGDEFAKINEETDEYSFDFTGEKLQQVADAFGTTPEFIQLMERAMVDAGMSVKMTSQQVDDYNAELDNLVSKSTEAQEKLKQMQSEGKISSDINLDFNTAEMSLDDIQSKISELQNERITIEASGDTEGLNAIDEEIATLQNQQVLLSIKAQVDAGTSIRDLLAMDDTTLAATLQIDSSQVEQARSELESLNGEVVDTSVTVKIDESQFAQLTGESKEVTVTAKAEGKNAVDDLKTSIDNLKGKNVKAQAEAIGKSSVDALREAIENLHNKTVTATALTSGILSVQSLASAIDSLSSKTVTITTNYVQNGSPSAGRVNGTVLSPAKVNGTAYNVLNMSKPAYVGGKIALSQDELALTNESGVESIVRDGVWRLLPGGAHFENLKKGDIIFSAEQTRDLLKYGRTNGHARAYASGTLNAYDSGSGGFRRPNSGNNTVSVAGNSSSSSSSTSSNTYSYNQNTSAVQSNTAATEANTEATEESISTFDWVKTKLDKFAKNVERISNQITDYISSNLKATLLKRQISAMDKEIQAQQSAYNTYLEKANSIELSNEYKKLVQNGAFKIEDIDTSTDSGKELADNISKYQEYYEAAQDCKDAVVDLKNEQYELFEQWANMPTEKAEKAIEKLERKYESLSSVQSAITGHSALELYKDLVNTDNPEIAESRAALKIAEQNQANTASAQKAARNTLSSSQSSFSASSNQLLNELNSYTNSTAKSLRNAAKGKVSSNTYSAITNAIKNGKKVSTKGLKGEALKAAKEYNKAIEQEKGVTQRVENNKTVKVSKLTDNVKDIAKQYNSDIKALNQAQTEFNNAKKANEEAQEALLDAQNAKESADRATTAEQQTLAMSRESPYTFLYQNNLLNKEVALLEKENERRQKALDSITNAVDEQQEEYDSAVSKRDKKAQSLLNNKNIIKELNNTQIAAIEAGKAVSTSGVASNNILKQLNAYNNLVDAASDSNTKLNILLESQSKAVSNAAQAEAEYIQKLVENEQIKLDNITAYFDSMFTQYDNRASMLDSYINRVELQGNVISENFYKSQIENEEARLKQLQIQRDAMVESFNKSVQQGIIKEGTEEYWQMQDSIDQVSMSILEAENNVIELNNSIRDLEWEQFDRIQESISRITDESDFLIDLLSHRKLYDDDGNLTDIGLTTMGLHGVNYNTYMTQADKYRQEMEKIESELANDPYNQDLIDRRNELLDLQQDAILAAEDEKDAIVDLVEEGIEYELDNLKELIDAYLEMLQAQKDLYDYQKKVKDQTEEIASLEKQLAAYQGDNSEESRAKIQEIKLSLEEAREDLEETQYDRYISEQKKLLDELYNQYEEIINKRLDNVDALLENVIAQINSNSSIINSTLISETDKVGYILTPEMQNIWNATNGVSDVISMYGANFESHATTIQSTISNIYTRMADMISAINSQANSYIQAVDKLLQSPVKEEEPEDTSTDNNKDEIVIGEPGSAVVGNDSVSIGNSSSNKNNSNKNNSNSNSNKNNSGGDGKAKVGDTCTYVSGRYYAASDGSGAWGNRYLGKKVKIVSINSANWAKYPYLIRSADGKIDLGWVKLSQLKGYASGIKYANKNEFAWTQENGVETIIRPSDGAVLTPIKRGDMVLNNGATNNIWDMANNPTDFIRDNIADMIGTSIPSTTTASQSIKNNFDNITFNLPNVINSDDFINEMVNNKRFEKLIQSMSIDMAAGKSSLSKYKFRR